MFNEDGTATQDQVNLQLALASDKAVDVFMDTMVDNVKQNNNGEIPKVDVDYFETALEEYSQYTQNIERVTITPYAYNSFVDTVMNNFVNIPQDASVNEIETIKNDISNIVGELFTYPGKPSPTSN